MEGSMAARLLPASRRWGRVPRPPRPPPPPRKDFCSSNSRWRRRRRRQPERQQHHGPPARRHSSRCSSSSSPSPSLLQSLLREGEIEEEEEEAAARAGEMQGRGGRRQKQQRQRRRSWTRPLRRLLILLVAALAASTAATATATLMSSAVMNAMTVAVLLPSFGASASVFSSSSSSSFVGLASRRGATPQKGQGQRARAARIVAVVGAPPPQSQPPPLCESAPGRRRTPGGIQRGRVHNGSDGCIDGDGDGGEAENENEASAHEGGHSLEEIHVAKGDSGGAAASSFAVCAALERCWGRRPLLIRGAVSVSAAASMVVRDGADDGDGDGDGGGGGGGDDLSGSKFTFKPLSSILPTPGQLVQMVAASEEEEDVEKNDGDDETFYFGREPGNVDAAAAAAAAGESARNVRQLVEGRPSRRNLRSLELSWGPFSMSELRWVVRDADAAEAADDDDERAKSKHRKGEGTEDLGKDKEEEKRFGRFGRTFPQVQRRRKRQSGGGGANRGNTARTEARTLLLNDVDRHVPELADWLDFEFAPALLQLPPPPIDGASDGGGGGGAASPTATAAAPQLLPRWRRDDAQLSLSSEHGGIGPHVDSYDVFLIQVAGEKRWTLSERPMSVREESDRILPDLDVRVLDLDRRPRRRRNAEEAWATTASDYDDDQDQDDEYDPVLMREAVVVRPGDVLYVPPRFVHDGVALADNCQTLSVGCRAPSASELLARVADRLVLAAGASGELPRTVEEAGAARYTEDTLRMPFGVREEEGGDDPVGGATLSRSVKDIMKDMVRRAVDAVLEDDCLWDELVGRLATESLRGSDLASLVLGAANDEDGPDFDGGAATVWQRRPGVSLATTQPSPTRVRLFCHGEMWEADLPSEADSRRLLALLRQLERGEQIHSCAVDGLSCPMSTYLWKRLVADGVVIPVG